LSDGTNSSGRFESLVLDLARDLPTTPGDVAAQRELRAQVASWFSLSADEIDEVLPSTALDRRPTARAEWQPFSLD